MIDVPHARQMPGHRHGGSTGWNVSSDGRPLLKVDLSVVMARAWDNINNTYGGDCDWYAALPVPDGRVWFRGYQPFTTPPPADVCHLMVDVCRAVNRALHADGFWLIVWHPQQRMSMIWSDGDGTPKFSVDVDETWARVRRWPIDDFVERAHLGQVGYIGVREMAGAPVKYDRLRPAAQNPGWLGSDTRH